MRTAALFGAQRREEPQAPQPTPQTAASATLPQAIRPAVEIIARLSAERARLRAELARLRAGGTDAAVRAELEQVKAERDALKAENERLRARVVRTPPRAGPSPALAGLVDRLERSLGRLETATQGVEKISVSFGRQAQATAAPTPTPTARRPQRERRVVHKPDPLKGNGMMATLLRQNLSLRDDPADAEPSRPEPSGRRRRPVPASPLAALARENAELRERAPRTRRRAPRPAHPLAGLVAENKALRTVTRQGDTTSRAA